MILKKCAKEDINRVLEYIYDDRLQCFYMYMDIVECGIEDEGLDLWTCEEADAIKAVIYRYYDCIHIYSRGVCPAGEFLTIIHDIDPKVIVSDENIINTLRAHLDDSQYIYELNHIITTDVLMKENPELNIMLATKDDVPEIAELMMKDHIYNSVYTYEKLSGDLIRRLEDGFGRLFIIRDENGRLICADATNAETEDLAVIGGLVTDPEMRGRGLGAAMTGKVWNTVLREGKRGIAFLLDDNEKTINLHKKLKYDFIGMSARLIRKD